MTKENCVPNSTSDEQIMQSLISSVDKLQEMLNGIKNQIDGLQQGRGADSMPRQTSCSLCNKERCKSIVSTCRVSQSSNCPDENVGASHTVNLVPTNPVHHSLRFEDVIKSFKQFKGDYHISIFSWLLHFNEQSGIFNLSSLEKFVYAKRLMSGSAKHFIEYESKAVTFDQLAAELIEEYGNSANSALVHQKLRERKKRRDESTTQYLYEMLAIASQSEVDTAAIISYTVNGLPGPNHVKAHMFDAESLKDFKKKLQSYEIQLALTKSDQSNESQSRNMERNHDKAIPVNVPADSFTREKGPKCFQCGHFGHVKSDCKAATHPRINIVQRIDQNEWGDEKDMDDDQEIDVDDIRMSKSDEERMYKKLYYQSHS